MTSSFPLTLREMADLIAGRESRPADVDGIYQQLRGLQQFDVFRGTDRNGTRGAWRFDQCELARARLLLSLLDIGVGRKMIADASADLNATNLDAGHGIQPATVLGRAVENIAAPEAHNWEFVVDIYRDGSGDLALRSVLICELDAPTEAAVTLARIKAGERTQARIVIPATALITPLLSAAGA